MCLISTGHGEKRHAYAVADPAQQLSIKMKHLTALSYIIGIMIIGLVNIYASPMVLSENEKGELSEAEKIKIDAWIKKNNLNRYGDPKNMMYRGGTPLFNEGTGESTDRYEYILRKHPDRPWLNLK